ncbi:ATP-binding protein [Kitasatospora sp. NPDC051164]|uniref:ATP-binding protein n=1 Tax=Kitasatospora sp. NPDC051164 TaxID=3364055 RepID=UPI0037AF3A35
MSTLIEAAAVAVPSALALAGGGAVWHLRGSLRAERRRSDRLQRHAENLTRQLRAAELLLGQVADEVVPAIQAAVVRPGAGQGVDFTLPDILRGTVFADRVRAVVDSVAAAMRQVQYDAETATGVQVSQVKQEAEAAAAEAQRAAEEAAQAAVRSFAASLVVIASRVSRQISEGVRWHAGGEAYETLVTIDRLVQQLLLVAQNYVILGGGKLSRRWPATTFTDVVQAAMGHLEGFERIKHEESDVALTSRAVGPAVHTIAVLLDNALKYSPSSASVDVRLLNGHHGLTVRIDDAGLQMNREAVMAARQTLNGQKTAPVTQHGAHPRTGFAVAAALAREYGFSVDLEAPNAYRGTSVQIFFPSPLLTHAPEEQGAGVQPAPPAPAPTTTSTGLTVRQRGAALAPRQPAAGAEHAQPGRASVVAAWAAGTSRARPTTPEGA